MFFKHQIQIISNKLTATLVKLQFYRCIGCNAPSDSSSDLCSACRALLPPLENACICCAEPLSASPQNLLCAKCLTRPPAFDRVHALWRYEGVIPHFIGQLKFHRRLAIAHVFGKQLASTVQTYYQTAATIPDAILPVPLHKARLRIRGFNQALELARPVAKILNRPLLTNHCIRIRNTAEQAQLSLPEREKNLKNSFIVTNPLRFQRLIVIDDVVTTTHTVNALSAVLKKQGITQVDVWCCARTPRCVQ